MNERLTASFGPVMSSNPAMSLFLPPPTNIARQVEPAPSSPPSNKAQRLLACQRCQQRKTKCDRKSPCGTCVASSSSCVPATSVRSGQRKRRFAERELLYRLRKCEDLLRKHKIDFSYDAPSGNDEPSPDSARADVESPGVIDETLFDAKYLWRVLDISAVDGDSDDSVESRKDQKVKSRDIWDSVLGDNDFLLFAETDSSTDLSTLHPDPAEIFRLWQVYLDNVDPLLKVTHTPSLQGRIIGAVGNLHEIDDDLEALMFSIYCIASQSTRRRTPQAPFYTPADEALSGYRLGCRKALLRSKFIRTSNRDCLTALFLYLLSVRSDTVPKSMSSVLGMALRIAKRMGVHNESTLSTMSTFDAEMSRRVWWAIVLFDARISEMADCPTSTLMSPWDCKIPANVSDSELRVDMTQAPTPHQQPTEAFIIVGRAEICTFLRRTAVHRGVNNSQDGFPSKTQIHTAKEKESSQFAEMIEGKYMAACNLETPVQFVIYWMSRAALAKFRLLEHFVTGPRSMNLPAASMETEAALQILECDSQLMGSALTKRFAWMMELYFPIPAYMQAVRYIKQNPTAQLSDRCWKVMTENYESRQIDNYPLDTPFLKPFTKLLLEAWEIRCKALSQPPQSEVPDFVRKLYAAFAQLKRYSSGEHELLGTIPFPLAPRQDMSELNDLETIMDQTSDFNMHDLSWKTMSWEFFQGDPEYWTVRT